MADRPRVEPDAEVLSASVAERLLKRASELDAVRSTGTAVAELRAAAAEAGISADAFDAALGELQKAEEAPPPVSARNRRWRRRFFGLAAAGAVALFAAMIVVPSYLVVRTTDNMVEYTLPLNCLSGDKTLDLIRPLLKEPANTIALPSNSSRTVIIRATPDQMRSVRAALDQADKAESCARK